jgi:hypothetical protein
MTLEPSFASEIASAVDVVMSENSAQEPEVVAKEEPKAEREVEREEPEAGPEAQRIEHDKPAEKPEPAKPAISDESLARAVKAGLSLADARSFSDESALRRVIDAIERPHGASKTEVPVEKKPEHDPLDSLKLDPEHYEPEVVKVVDTLVGEIKRQREEISGLKGRHDEIARSSAETMAREVERWFDAQIAGLGEGLHEALGEGGISTLSPGSAQLAKREAIAEEMAIRMAGYKAAGKTQPPRDDVFRRAVQVVLHDDLIAAEEKRVSEEVGARAKQTIQRAGGPKATHKKSPMESTVDLLKEKFDLS